VSCRSQGKPDGIDCRSSRDCGTRGQRGWTNALVCTVALLASGCGGSEVATCIPPGAHIPAVHNSNSAAAALAAPAAVDLYLDASESMKGFLTPQKSKGGTTYEKVTYEKVVNDLTAYAGQKSRIAFPFGDCVSALDPMERELPLRPIFYEQLSKVKPDICADINRSTRFDKLFDKIKERHASPHGGHDRLSIVVTDLFLDEGNRYLGGVPAALAPIQPILDSGLAVAVLGVKVPFRGNIYLPPRATQPGPARPARPPLQELTHVQVQDTLLTLYVLNIGRPEHIRHLLSYLESNSFRNELADGRSLTARGASQNVHFHLFTKRRFVEPAVAIAELSNAHVPIESAEVAFIRIQGEENPVKSFDLLEDTHPTVVVPPKWLEGTWPVDLKVTNRSWVFYPSGDCRESWEPIELPLQASYQDGAIRLQFDDESLKRIYPGMIHLSHIEATVRPAAQSQKPSWLRDWSISAAEAWQFDGKNPRFFPTLDLEQILETMEQAALKGVLESPEKVAAFNIAYRKKP
jgi:hypothetical protein